MAQTSQQVIDLPLTLEGFVPKDVRLYVLRLLFQAGGEYSQQELRRMFGGISDDTIERDLTEIQTCEHVFARVPLECRVVYEKRWRMMPNEGPSS